MMCCVIMLLLLLFIGVLCGCLVFFCYFILVVLFSGVDKFFCNRFFSTSYLCFNNFIVLMFVNLCFFIFKIVFCICLMYGENE